MRSIFKFISIAFMIAIVLVQTFSTVAVIVQFKSNENYYAQVLCINKNRPELACHGKCVLMQRLQRDFEQDRNTNQQTLQNILDRDFNLFLDDIKLTTLSRPVFCFSETAPINSFYSSSFSSRLGCDIFHPPA